jgi:hypothetical protein
MRRVLVTLAVVLALPAADVASATPVAKPRFVRNIATGETGWFSSPGLADLDGDGRLEIVLSTFDHGIDVFRVPGSDAKDVPWPTARGGLLRAG